MLFKAPISYNPEHPFFNDFKFLYHAAAGRAQVRQTIPSPADLYLEILTITDDDPGQVYPSPKRLSTTLPALTAKPSADSTTWVAAICSSTTPLPDSLLTLLSSTPLSLAVSTS